MLSFVAVLAVGCATTGSGTVPKVECRGREPIPLTAAQAATMPRWQLEPIVAQNETLERECGVRAPKGGGR